MTDRRPAAGPTAAALSSLSGTEAAASTLPPSIAQRAVDTVSGWLSARTSRRGLLVRAGVVGTALAADPKGYVLRPGTAYASVCGPGSSCTSGWTVFCATINNGVNTCPPGSIAAGWWKADGASLCGGGARYIIDCNATCSRCSTTGGRAGICDSRCWSCSCTCGPTSSCDQRRVCCNAFRYGQCNTHVQQVGGVHCRVVSCTPPWRFENCSTSPATDNRTRDHSSDRLPTSFTAITRRYMDLGENGSALGATVYGEFPVPGGRAQRYQRGRITWSSTYGARETVGAIAARYLAVGAEGGPLGVTASYQITLPDGSGRANFFARGRIAWHPDVGAFDVENPLSLRHRADGYEQGRLGYAVTGTTRTADGRGRFNRFQGGRITATPEGSAFLLRGGIADLYARLGAETGVLGYPASDERHSADGRGRFNWFRRGRIWWYPNLGIFETRGAIDQRYHLDGSDSGSLGLPVSGQRPTDDGRGAYNLFQNGRITLTASGRPYLLRGAIAERYAELDAEAGLLGHPASNELPTPDGAGRVSRFERGRLTLTPSGGVFFVRGPIDQRYEELGAEGSDLGYPISDEYQPEPGYRRNDFEHGQLTLNESTGEVRRS